MRVWVAPLLAAGVMWGPGAAWAQNGALRTETATMATATASAGVAILHLGSEPPGLTFHRRTKPGDAFEAVCTTPCVAQFAPNTYDLTLASGDAETLPSAKRLAVASSADLEGEIVSHAKTRRNGWIVLGSVVTAGLAVFAVGLATSCDSRDKSCQRRAAIGIWGGLGMAALGTSIGVPLVVTDDEVTIRVKE